MKRVIFYFDGFNFYNGLKEQSDLISAWKNYYWLDFIKFCNGFISVGHELLRVNYFTAPPSNNEKRSRQSALLSANKLINGQKFQVHQGRYQDKSIQCKLCKKMFMQPEEKRTDVNIAVTMMLDCFQDNVDTLILVSADSDQVPTVQSIKKFFPNKTIRIYFPPKRNSADLLSICKPVVFLENNEDKFKVAVMPYEIKSDAKRYTRPANWKG